MKKRILRSIVGLIVIAAFTLPGCDFIDACGQCTFIVEVDGVVDEDQTGLPIPFCGDSYIDKQNSSATTDGNTLSYWDCI